MRTGALPGHEYVEPFLRRAGERPENCQPLNIRETRMDIGGIGEFSLIARIRRRMEGNYPSEVKLGIGDDCAVLQPDAGMEWVITTDSQVEDVHFRRAWLTPYQIGWRAMAVNLSDVAAIGGTAIRRPCGAGAACYHRGGVFRPTHRRLKRSWLTFPVSAHRWEPGK